MRAIDKVCKQSLGLGICFRCLKIDFFQNFCALIVMHVSGLAQYVYVYLPCLSYLLQVCTQ